MRLFTGSGVAIITPFNENGVDFDKLGELIEMLISNDTDAIIVCGTTGEASTMTEEEKKATIKYTVEKVNKRIPVIAGSGSNNTASSIKFSIWCESIGADGLLVITPYYNKTSKKGLVEHFKAIAESVKLPIMLYNVPGRTGMNLEPSVLYSLKDIENIVSVKEASGNISQIAAIKALCGDRFDIYSGNDDQIIPILSLGGAGVVSVAANIMPKEFHDMCHLYLEGKHSEALKLQLDTLNLTNSLFIETNPIPIKTAMNLLGYKVGNLRLPLTSMEDKNLEILRNELKAYGFSLKEE